MASHEVARYLQAYCDGEIEASKMLEVEAHLETCSSCRHAVEAEQAFREELRTKIAREPVPRHVAERLRSALNEVEEVERRRPTYAPAWGERAPLLALAASVLLVVGVVLGYLIGQSDSKAEVHPLVMELVGEHTRITLREDPAELSTRDTQQVALWVQGRIGHAVHVPDYSSTGIQLLGGRVTRLGGRPAAYIVYEKGRNIISLFSFPGYEASLSGLKEIRRDGRTFLTGEYRGQQMLLWESGNMTYVLISNVGWSELFQCAEVFLKGKHS